MPVLAERSRKWWSWRGEVARGFLAFGLLLFPQFCRVAFFSACDSKATIRGQTVGAYDVTVIGLHLRIHRRGQALRFVYLMQVCMCDEAGCVVL